jgi:hypothetical protein
LCCLFFLDLWILISPLVSLNSSDSIMNKDIIRIDEKPR